MNLRLEISAPIFVKNRPCNVGDVQFIRDGHMWQAVTTFPSININQNRNTRLKVLQVYNCIYLYQKLHITAFKIFPISYIGLHIRLRLQYPRAF